MKRLTLLFIAALFLGSCWMQHPEALGYDIVENCGISGEYWKITRDRTFDKTMSYIHGIVINASWDTYDNQNMQWVLEKKNGDHQCLFKPDVMYLSVDGEDVPSVRFSIPEIMGPWTIEYSEDQLRITLREGEFIEMVRVCSVKENDYITQ